MDASAQFEATRTRQRTLVEEHLTDLLHLLESQGWENTTVDELARAAGMSRATFFRIFGGKEDVVFLDHESMLEQLETFLSTTTHDTASALRQGLLLVFRHHLDDRERTTVRHRLLQQSQGLRNRELLTSYRYQRIFRRWIRERLSQDAAFSGVAEEHVDALAVSLAGAGVALHNSSLRRWLSAPSEEVDEELSEQLQHLIRVMLDGYAATGQDGTAEGVAGQRPVAVVTLMGEHADREQIVEAVRQALA